MGIRIRSGAELARAASRPPVPVGAAMLDHARALVYRICGASTSSSDPDRSGSRP